MYALASKPSTSNEAYDTLETVFGGDAFTDHDALDALVEVLNVSEESAKRELNALFQIGAIEEV